MDTASGFSLLPGVRAAFNKRLDTAVTDFAPDHPVQAELSELRFVANHYLTSAVVTVQRYEEVLKKPERLKMVYLAGRLVPRQDVLNAIAYLRAPEGADESVIQQFELEKQVLIELCSVYAKGRLALPFLHLCFDPELRANPAAWVPHLEACLEARALEVTGEHRQTVMAFKKVLPSLIPNDLPDTLRLFHRLMVSQVNNLRDLGLSLNGHPIIQTNRDLRRALAPPSSPLRLSSKTADGRWWGGNALSPT